MKRLVVVALAFVALGATAGGAAAAPAAPQASPQAQINSLKKQVATLQKQVKFLTSEISANYAGDACAVALTADTFQWTWLRNNPGGSTFNTAQGPLNDKGACSDIRVSRPRPTDQVAPVLSQIFDALIAWINP